MPLLGVFPALFSDAPTLPSVCFCEPNWPPSGARLVVFSGDLFVDIVCEQQIDVNQVSIQLVISNVAEYG